MVTEEGEPLENILPVAESKGSITVNWEAVEMDKPAMAVINASASFCKSFEVRSRDKDEGCQHMHRSWLVTTADLLAWLPKLTIALSPR